MRQDGFTLVELMVVVLILSVVAAAVLTSQSSSEAELTLDAAAAEVAAAFRFARSEAIRTGEAHGVIADVSSQRVRVYHLNESISPAAIEYTVRHPVDKKLYDLDFTNDPMLGPVSVTNATFWYEGVAFPSNLVGYNCDGTPKFNLFGSIKMLTLGGVTLTAAGQNRVISVTPMTGRVTVQ